jgi:hypothetical protein
MMSYIGWVEQYTDEIMALLADIVNQVIGTDEKLPMDGHADMISASIDGHFQNRNELRAEQRKRFEGMMG